jgi:hypothetical protein
MCIRTYHISDYVDIRVNGVVHESMPAKILGILDRWCEASHVVRMKHVRLTYAHRRVERCGSQKIPSLESWSFVIK